MANFRLLPQMTIRISPAFAIEQKGRRMYEYKATLISVVDGDTIHAAIDLGFDQWVNKTLRFTGINAPELPTPEGVAAKAFVVASLDAASNTFVITTEKDHREKYGRYLATLWLPNQNVSLNQQMVNEGFAVPYNG